MTVMFCDLVGSTAMSQKIDAEDLQEVLREYHRIGQLVVSSYGGHIAQYLGDGLLAYFGYPTAHEDDAERAVRAGLGLLIELEKTADTMPQRLEARIGIHTGPVVLGDVGGPHRRETLAQGSTLNIAARLQAAAQACSLVISDDTLRLVPGMFLTEDLGKQTLKGVEGPVHIHRVIQPTGVRSRLDISGDRLTPLVGRDLELGLLLDRWEQVREGDGQVVLVTGEAGVGKSRLALALRQRLEGQAHSWIECRCSPFAQSTPFQPVMELVQQGLVLLPTDSDTDKLAKLERGIGILGFDLAEWVPLFAAFLGISVGPPYNPLDITPELQRQKTVEGLTRWLLALSALQPLVLMIEDLHWIDPSSLAVLTRVVEQSPTARLLLVGTARPEFTAPWRHQSNQTPIQLTHLSKRQSRDLAQRISPDRRLPEEVLDTITERAGGVPLFVEELTRMVLESGLLTAEGDRYVLKGLLSDLAIPHTLHDSLAARLDRLSAAKNVAQIASALGREFAYPLLAAVASIDEPALRQGLERLVQAELVYQRGEPPDATYTFKHALVQDAAYETMLRKSRQELHARIARAMTERFPQQVEAAPEQLARHLDVSGQVMEAIGYYRKAAEQAAARQANLEALTHAERGLELLHALPERGSLAELELVLLLTAGNASIRSRGYGHPATVSSMERAAVLCDEVTNIELRAMALTSLSANLSACGRAADAIDLARNVIELGRSTGVDTFLLLGNVQAAFSQLVLDRPRECLDYARAALAVYSYDAHGHIGLTFSVDQAVAAHNFAQWALDTCGFPEQAIRHFDELKALAAKIGHPSTLAYKSMAAATTATDLYRDMQTAQREAAEGIAVSQRYGFAQWLVVNTTFLYTARAWAEPTQENIDSLMTAYQSMVDSGMSSVGTFWKNTAGALISANRPDLARSVLCGLPASEGRLYWNRLMGQIILLEKGDEAAAEAQFHSGIALAKERGSLHAEVLTTIELARLWQRHGKREEAYQLLEPVYASFTEGFDFWYMKEARRLLDELKAAK